VAIFSFLLSDVARRVQQQRASAKVDKRQSVSVQLNKNNHRSAQIRGTSIIPMMTSSVTFDALQVLGTPSLSSPCIFKIFTSFIWKPFPHALCPLCVLSGQYSLCMYWVSIVALLTLIIKWGIHSSFFCTIAKCKRGSSEPFGTCIGQDNVRVSKGPRRPAVPINPRYSHRLTMRYCLVLTMFFSQGVADYVEVVPSSSVYSARIGAFGLQRAF
jgi:hypothetical protein